MRIKAFSHLALIFAGGLALAGFTHADPVAAPTLKITRVAELPRPLPAPYNPNADARAQVASAIAKARRGDKLVLIELGGNWCIDCRVMAGILALPQMRPWMAKYYEVVHVDVGRFDTNLDIPARYGLQLRAVPALMIVDPESGRMLNKGRELALSDASIMQPQAVADWLAQWVRD